MQKTPDNPDGLSRAFAPDIVQADLVSGPKIDQTMERTVERGGAVLHIRRDAIGPHSRRADDHSERHVLREGRGGHNALGGHFGYCFHIEGEQTSHRSGSARARSGHWVVGNQSPIAFHARAILLEAGRIRSALAA
ncbi:MAG: hypothetical protein ACR2F0_04105 [Chthoniobacterales bacterium]